MGSTVPWIDVRLRRCCLIRDGCGWYPSLPFHVLKKRSGHKLGDVCVCVCAGVPLPALWARFPVCSERAKGRWSVVFPYDSHEVEAAKRNPRVNFTSSHDTLNISHYIASNGKAISE